MSNIEICKRCLSKGFSFESGIVCNLTNDKANFTDTCPDFKENKEAKAAKSIRKRLLPNEERARIASVLIGITLVLTLV